MSAWRLAALGTAAALVLVASATLGRGVVGPETAPPASASLAGPAERRAAASPVAWLTSRPSRRSVTVSDRDAGFSIDIPAEWSRRATADPDVRLLATGAARTSLLIRVTPLGLTVTPGTLGLARDLTDALIGADHRVRLLARPRVVSLHGLAGYRYDYRTSRGGTAHMHYFVFMRRRLVALVFQVHGDAPHARVAQLDRIARTFRAAT